MRFSKGQRLLLVVAGLLVTLASVAVAADRLQGVPEPADLDESARTNAINTDESELGQPTAQELAEARSAAALELVFLETHGLDAIHRGAIDGATTIVLPPVISSAMDMVMKSKAQDSDRILVQTEASQRGSTRVETALYTDGHGLVQLTWQDWPPNVDLQSVVPSGSRVEQIGNLDVMIRELEHDNFVEVWVFDGTILARAETSFTVDVKTADVRAMAMALFEAAASSG